MTRLSELLAYRLQELMDERGKTISDLHEATGLSRTRIYEYLAGDSDPRLSSLEKVAGFLRLEIRDLIDPNPEPKPLSALKREIIRTLATLDDEKLRPVRDLLAFLAAGDKAPLEASKKKSESR